jgi:alkylated DNA nucleotide flippase Atl1
MRKEEVKTEKDVMRFLSDKTEFERKVLVTTYNIPKGKVITYKRIAEKIGRPRAYRLLPTLCTRIRFTPLFHATASSHLTADSEEKRKQPTQEGNKWKKKEYQPRIQKSN